MESDKYRGKNPFKLPHRLSQSHHLRISSDVEQAWQPNSLKENKKQKKKKNTTATTFLLRIMLKVKSLCLTKHHAVKTY
jgi:hypothetical protein